MVLFRLPNPFSVPYYLSNMSNRSAEGEAADVQETAEMESSIEDHDLASGEDTGSNIASSLPDSYHL